jgi:RNase P/RNase MRP subunit POP5
MVVKEKRGRKRYIFFKHSNKGPKSNLINFFRTKIGKLESKIKWKLIEANIEEGIIRVDHKLLDKSREIMNNESEELEIITVRTSGTIKGLKNS